MNSVHQSNLMDRGGLSLRANVSWTFIGNVVYAFCQWGILIVLAQVGSPELVGLFALGLTISVPPIMFASLRMRRVQATDAKDEYELGDYLSVRLVSTFLALLVIAILVAVLGYRQEAALVILFVGISKVVESISEVYYGQLHKMDRLDRIAQSMMLKGPLSLLALTIAVLLTGRVSSGVFALVIVWIAILFLFDIPNAAKVTPGHANNSITGKRSRFLSSPVGPSGNVQRLKRLAWMLLPLGVVGLLSSLQINIPRFFVEQQLGAHMLGIFAALLYFERAGTLVVDALGNSASPRLSRYYATRRTKDYRRLLGGMTGAGLLIAMAGVLLTLILGRQIVTFIYGAEYAQQDVFVRLMIAAGLAYTASFLNQGVSAARMFKVQAPLYLIVSTILVISCVLLVPVGGMVGAANALIIARAAELIGTLLIALYGLTVMSRHPVDQI